MPHFVWYIFSDIFASKQQMARASRILLEILKKKTENKTNKLPGVFLGGK